MENAKRYGAMKENPFCKFLDGFLNNLSFKIVVRAGRWASAKVYLLVSLFEKPLEFFLFLTSFSLENGASQRESILQNFLNFLFSLANPLSAKQNCSRENKA